MTREHDDYFFPDDASLGEQNYQPPVLVPRPIVTHLGAIDIVYFIKDDKLDILDEIGSLYSILLRISVVMIKHGASGLIWTSPVRIPTVGRPGEVLGKVDLKSRNFWFERALIGDV